jgi:hypothetical protein
MIQQAGSIQLAPRVSHAQSMINLLLAGEQEVVRSEVGVQQARAFKHPCLARVVEIACPALRRLLNRQVRARYLMQLVHHLDHARQVSRPGPVVRVASAADTLEPEQMPSRSFHLPQQAWRDLLDHWRDHRFPVLPHSPSVADADSFHEHQAGGGVEQHRQVRLHPGGRGMG